MRPKTNRYSEIVENKASNDYAYSYALFSNSNHEPTTKDKATYMEMYLYDSNDNVIERIYGQIGNGQ
jgi:hypothetical protein